MSSPSARRSIRSSKSATPHRSAAATASSPNNASPGARHPPGAAQMSQRVRMVTDRRGSNEVQSSPLFFRSSPGNVIVSPSSQRATPRPSGPSVGESSPIQYLSSDASTPMATSRPRASHRSSSAALFVNSFQSPDGQTPARERRGDISSGYHPGANRRQAPMVDQDGKLVPNTASSNGATFSNLQPNTSEADYLGGNSERVVWGTTLSQADVSRAFTDFLLNFQKKHRMVKDGELGENAHLPIGHVGHEREYVNMMRTMLNVGITALNLDMKNLQSYPPTVKLWHQLQDYPSDIIGILDNAVKITMIELAEKQAEELRLRNHRAGASLSRSQRSSSVRLAPNSDEDHHVGYEPTNGLNRNARPDLIQEVEWNTYRVRPFALDRSINLRDLNPGDIDRIISVKGLVIRTTPVIPDMKDAFFVCSVCNHSIVVELNLGKISEPTICPREACQQQNTMQIVHNRSGFADKQIVKLQETPDSVPDGQTPHSVSICAYNELVDFCKAGDRVEITGIFKCNQVRVNPRQRTVKSIYKTFVDAVHIQKVDKRRMGIDATTIEQELSEQASTQSEVLRKVTEEEESRIKDVAARPDVYELLSRSLAPSIYEMDDVKKGILLQLFGGTNKSFEKGGNPKYRGDINVLLCGDPSTSKSQLLQYVHKIAPRGIYTSGKGSSAVGLTAYITRDPETRQLVLESGALVLSDGGVCCIDEFDKMSDSTRSVLHEVMEQQTVSIAKAGIITTLNARTSILASANPIGSKYNPSLPVPQNIDLPPTLLSRFDLVYLVLDRIDEQTDRRLAKHLVGMYLEDSPDNASTQEILPVDFLTSYISYARSHCHPLITQPASEELVKAYVEMRKLGEDVRAAERRITATTRQLESMIRLSEAHAKMRLAAEVTRDDVIEAVRLIKTALKQAATDAQTGLLDMALLTEGTSASEKRRKQDLKNAINNLLDEMTRSNGNVRYADLAKRVMEHSSVQVGAEEFAEALRALQQEGIVQIVGEGPRRSVRKLSGL